MYTENNIDGLEFSIHGHTYKISNVRKEGSWRCRLDRTNYSRWSNDDYDVSSVIGYLNDGSYKVINQEPTINNNYSIV